MSTHRLTELVYVLAKKVAELEHLITRGRPCEPSGSPSVCGASVTGSRSLHITHVVDPQALLICEMNPKR